jgi:hypothetical protein
VLVAAGICGAASLSAQQLQFVVSAVDKGGDPVPDLSAREIVMTEGGARATTLKVEPYAVPVKLTIAIDNGLASADALVHYRSGLTRLVDALPFDLEVTLITTAPQPRIIVPATTDRLRIRRGITGFAPEDARPGFSDTLVEYSRRIEADLKSRQTLDYLPVLLMISTTANEGTNYQTSEIERAIEFLIVRKAMVIVTMTSTRPGTVVGDLNSNRQALIAIPTTKATGGRYEALSASSRLATLLPELGRAIAALHRAHANQLRVTIQRPEGVTGPIRDPNVYVTRRGVTATVSLDGFPPRAAQEEVR